MELKSFIENFADQFDETPREIFNENTQFKNLDEWSSILALSLIAMADDEYTVKLKGDDIKKSETIRDLFEIIKSRQ